MTSGGWRVMVLGLALTGAGSTVFAANSRAAGRQAPEWELGAGAAYIDFPEYRGAETRFRRVLPFPYVVYRGKRLKVDREGARGLLFQSRHTALDISLDGSVPVRSDDGGPRRGMPDLDPVLEVGPSFRIRLRRQPDLEVRLVARAVLATDFERVHQEGWLFNPQLYFRRRGYLDFGASAGPLYATRAYHRYYYAVPARFETPTRPAYEPPAGYSGMRVTMSLSRRFNGMYIGSFLRYDDLRGAAFVDSPLVETKQALMAGISVAWVFRESRRRVTVVRR